MFIEEAIMSTTNIADQFLSFMPTQDLSTYARMTVVSVWSLIQPSSSGSSASSSKESTSSMMSYGGSLFVTG